MAARERAAAVALTEEERNRQLLAQVTIYFDYDSSEIRADFNDMLRAHARQLAQVIRHAQPRAQPLDQRDARVFVSGVRGQDVGGCHRLAEIVHQHGEAHRHAAAELDGLAQRQKLMHAGVDLRMPLRRLRHAEQRVHFGKNDF